jgi:hypothetical protein
MFYHWQQKGWSRIRFKQEGFEDLLFQFAEDSGKLRGVLLGLSAVDQLRSQHNSRQMKVIKTMTAAGPKGLVGGISTKVYRPCQNF